MNHVIVYKAKEDLTDLFRNHRLSSTSPHTIHCCTQIEQVYLLANKNKADLVFYIVPKLTEDDQIRIRNIKRLNSKVKINLFSDSAMALQAWKMEVFHFKEYPIDLDDIIYGYKKYIRSKQGDKVRELNIKTPEGLFKIPYNRIKYLHANGNYTFVYYGEKDSKIITKQIKHFEFITEQDESIVRVNRSFIINLNLIKAIEDQMVSFVLGDTKVKVSKNLSVKLKKLIVGK